MTTHKTRRLLNSALSAIDDMVFADPADMPALTAAYERRFATYAAAAKTETVTVASAMPAVKPAEIVEPVASNRLTGTVKFWSSAGYGYLLANGKEYYAQARNLRFLAAPIAKGDVVSFIPAAMIGENSGMPKARDVFPEGYTPAPASAPVLSARVMAAKEKVAAERAAKRAAPVATPAIVSTDYMDAFYDAPDADDDAATQQRDVLAVLS